MLRHLSRFLRRRRKMENNKTLVNDLTTGPVFKKLILFALPMMLANLLQAVYSMVDMIIVGQFVGAAGLSAVGIGGQVTMIMLNMCTGFTYGGQILISQQIGMKNKDLQTTIGTLLTVEFLLGIVCGVFGIALNENILNWLNTPAEAYADARAYLMICCAGMIFIFGYNAICAILRGMGESKLPMIFVAISSVINLVLDYVFVAPMGMGAGGAALATVISQAIAFILAFIYLYTHKEAFQFDFKPASFIPRTSRLLPMCRVGIPYMIQGLLISGSMVVVNAQVNVYGVAASAADSVGGKLNSVANICIGATSAATATMMGQCFGAREFDRMKRCFWACEAVCMVCWCILSAIYLLFPEWVFRIFTSEPEVLEIAPLYLKIAVVWLLSLCTMNAPYALVEGVGAAGFNLVVGILDGVVARIGLALLLGHFWGLAGLWLGTSLAGFVTTIMMGIYYASGKWMKRKTLLSE